MQVGCWVLSVDIRSPKPPNLTNSCAKAGLKWAIAAHTDSHTLAVVALQSSEVSGNIAFMSHAFAADDGDLDAAPYTETQYQASYSYSSANASTMPIMMGFVFLGYFALLTVYLSFCCVGRQVYSFHALTNVERQTIAGGKPQSGYVAQLDEIWRKQFIVKVYGILCIQLAVTVAICFGMMQ